MQMLDTTVKHDYILCNSPKQAACTVCPLMYLYVAMLVNSTLTTWDVVVALYEGWDTKINKDN